MARDDLRLRLIRFDRWLEARYRRRGWARVRVWCEDASVGGAIGLVAVLIARAC
jgi:hypothetical protein